MFLAGHIIAMVTYCATILTATYSPVIGQFGDTMILASNGIEWLERFSFECRKVIGFAFTTLRDWLKRFAPLFHTIRSKTKTNCVIASRTLRQLHVITLSFDGLTVLSVFFVIG